MKLFGDNRFQPVADSYQPKNGERVSILPMSEPLRGTFPTNSTLEAHAISVRTQENAIFYSVELYALDEGLMRFQSPDEDGDRAPDGLPPELLTRAQKGEPFGRFLARVPIGLVGALVTDNDTGKQELAFPNSFSYQLWMPPSQARQGRISPITTGMVMSVTPRNLWNERVIRLMRDVMAGKSEGMIGAMNEYLEGNGVDPDDHSPQSEEVRRLAYMSGHYSGVMDVLDLKVLECMSVLSISAQDVTKGSNVPLHTYLSVMLDALDGSPMMGANSFFGQLLMQEMMMSGNQHIDAGSVYALNPLNLIEMMDAVPLAPQGAGMRLDIHNPGESLNAIDTQLTASFAQIPVTGEEGAALRAAYVKACDDVRRLKSISEIVPALMTKGIASNLNESFDKMNRVGGFPPPAHGRVISSCTYQLLDVRELIMRIGSTDPEEVTREVLRDFREQRAIYNNTTESRMENTNYSSGEINDEGTALDEGDESELEEKLRRGVYQSIERLLNGTSEGEWGDGDEDNFRDILAGLDLSF